MGRHSSNSSSLRAVKMVRFLGVSSLLFISYIAVVLAADSIPRMQASDPGVALLGRRKVCAVGQSNSISCFRVFDDRQSSA